MYYELYIDVLFLVNFMMDYLLLLLLRKMLSCTATLGNIFLGAFVGALLTCIIIILPIPYAILKFILFHVFVNTVMIRVGLKIKNVRCFVKAYFMLYIGGFLLGGVLSTLQQYVRVGSLFFAVAVGGYLIVSKIWDYIAAIQKMKQYHCEVDLYIGDKKCRVQGIIDTGNGLCDPISNQPVSILDRNTARQFFGEEKLSKVRYIPYHSIGKKEGVMPALKIDRMCVFREEECWVKEPLIGVSEETISAGGEYQMILNPNLF